MEYADTARQDRELNTRELRNLAIEFRHRANHFGKLAYVSEFLVALCIFGGIYIFWYSDQILLQVQQSRIESNERDRTEELNRIALEQRSIETNRFEIIALDKAIDAAQKQSQTRPVQPRQEQVIQTPPGLPELAQRLNPNEQRRSDLKNSIARSERQIEASSKNIETLDKRRSDLRATPESQVAIAIATKVGAVLLLLFFVRVLVSIFRYYSRLAAFYLARADALHYHAHAKPQTLNEFAALVFPSGVEFDKNPEAADLPSVSAVKEVLAARAKP